MGSKIQAILFNKNYYTLQSASKWIYEHNFKPIKYHITEHMIRFRLYNPSLFKKFRTKKTKENIDFIIGFY